MRTPGGLTPGRFGLGEGCGFCAVTSTAGQARRANKVNLRMGIWSCCGIISGHRVPRHMRVIGLASLLFVTAATLRLGSQAPAPRDPRLELFEASIRPVLFGTCADCHVLDSEGGLRLDSREAMLKGGESGPAIVPGDPDKSLLIRVLRREAG